MIDLVEMEGTENMEQERDIVARLKEAHCSPSNEDDLGHDLYWEAAEEIERLRAQRDEAWDNLRALSLVKVNIIRGAPKRSADGMEQEKDIVERLRIWEDTAETFHGARTLREAAEEIERLREERLVDAGLVEKVADALQFNWKGNPGRRDEEEPLVRTAIAVVLKDFNVWTQNGMRWECQMEVDAYARENGIEL